MLYVLVDFSNVIKEVSSIEATLDYCVSKVLPYWQTLGVEDNVCQIRLYDGWDEQIKDKDPITGTVNLRSCMSRNAQEVVRIINRCYPKKIGGLTINVEMARSLLAASRMIFPFTLRKKQEFYRLELVQKERFCCDSARSHYEYLSEYVRKRRCCHCKDKAPVLCITEQKLVDTMIVSDMLYLRNFVDFIAIASDDDDMLPGVIQFVLSGGTICHVRTKKDQLSYRKYYDNFVSTYTDSCNYHVVV